MPISQKEFASKLRAEVPELKDFSDSQIVNKVLELRPDLIDKIENPTLGDQTAEGAQNRLQNQSSHISAVDPSAWQNHPIMKQLIQGITGSLPAAGTLGGAALASPETLGMGALAGGALGAGVGKGAQDYLNEILGLVQSSPLDKASNIGMETGIAAISPGIIDAILNPVKTARLGAGSLANVEDAVIPRKLRGWIGNSDMLRRFAAGGKQEIDPLVRPPFQSGLPDQSNPDTLSRLRSLIENDNPKGTISSSVADLQKAAKTSELPKFKVNGDGTFTNMSTGEVLDKSGKPVSIVHDFDTDSTRLNQLYDKAQTKDFTKADLDEARLLDSKLRELNFDKELYNKAYNSSNILKLPKKGLSNITLHLGPYLSGDK